MGELNNITQEEITDLVSHIDTIYSGINTTDTDLVQNAYTSIAYVKDKLTYIKDFTDTLISDNLEANRNIDNLKNENNRLFRRVNASEQVQDSIKKEMTNYEELKEMF